MEAKRDGCLFAVAAAAIAFAATGVPGLTPTGSCPPEHTLISVNGFPGSLLQLRQDVIGWNPCKMLGNIAGDTSHSQNQFVALQQLNGRYAHALSMYQHGLAELPVKV